ncbi:MAG: hypothetical protein ACSLEW_04395, partial [Nocardioides sp.]
MEQAGERNNGIADGRRQFVNRLFRSRSSIEQGIGDAFGAAARVSVAREPADVRSEHWSYVTQSLVVPANLCACSAGRGEDIGVLR